MKKCFKCGAVKPEDQFYKHPMMSDGRLGKCKDCTRKDSKARLLEKKRDPKWVKLERERIRIKSAAFRESGDPTIVLARKIFHRAVYSGKLHRPSCCEMCGTACKPHGHHHDYNRPLDVAWLCKPCHRFIHIKSDNESTTASRYPKSIRRQ